MIQKLIFVSTWQVEEKKRNLIQRFRFRYMSNYCYRVKPFWLIVLSNLFAEVTHEENVIDDKT